MVEFSLELFSWGEEVGPQHEARQNEPETPESDDGVSGLLSSSSLALLGSGLACECKVPGVLGYLS